MFWFFFLHDSNWWHCIDRLCCNDHRNFNFNNGVSTSTSITESLALDASPSSDALFLRILLPSIWKKINNNIIFPKQKKRTTRKQIVLTQRKRKQFFSSVNASTYWAHDLQVYQCRFCLDRRKKEWAYCIKYGHSVDIVS